MLALGGILFSGFELPDQINLGGRHALVTHQLPGGQRVVDAMGRDDDDVTWRGRFRGGQAAARARAVDALRTAGEPVTLAWGGFRHTVVVSEFQAEYRQRYEIPYAVTCVVVTPPPGATVPSLTDLLDADLTRVLGLGLDDVSAAVAGVRGAIATAKTLADGFRGGLTDIAHSVSLAQAALGQAAGAADAAAAAAGLPSAGPADFAAGLLAQADALARLDALHAAAAGVGRMAANIRTLEG